MSWGIRVASHDPHTANRHDHFHIQAKPDRTIYLLPTQDDDVWYGASADHGLAGGTISELASVIGSNLVRPDLATAVANGQVLEIEPDGETVAVPTIDSSDPALVTLTLTGIRVKALALVLALRLAVTQGRCVVG